jgi:hypothetical protein
MFGMSNLNKGVEEIKLSASLLPRQHTDDLMYIGKVTSECIKTPIRNSIYFRMNRWYSPNREGVASGSTPCPGPTVNSYQHYYRRDTVSGF